MRIIALPILFLSGFLNGMSQDSSRERKLVFMSITGGYVNSTVYGTMPEKDLQFDAPTGGKLHMKNGESFLFGVGMQKYFSDYIFFKSGIQYIRKNVNPEEETIVYYKDSLKVDYLSVPLLAGVNLLPVNKTWFNVYLEFGPIVNFRMADRSKIGPDRVAFSTPFVSIGLCPGLSIPLSVSPTQKFLFSYNYMYDLSNAHVETLYWSPSDPNRKFTYKYRSSTFSVEFQWSLF